MGWLWTFQLILDGAILWVLWKRLGGRLGAGDPPNGPVEATLRRKDFEQYQEALSDLCDRLCRESESWVGQLEQRTRVARQLLQGLEERSGVGERPVTPERQRNEEEAGAARADTERTPTQQEVLHLRSQGYTVEQIARQLHLGQREVQLLLSLRQQTS